MKALYRSNTGKIHAANANSDVNCNGRKMNGRTASFDSIKNAPESHFCKKCFLGGKDEAVFLAERLSKQSTNRPFRGLTTVNTMKTFLFTKRPSPKRGMDVRVNVYRIKHDQPTYLGSDHYQTRSTKGAFAVACQVIADLGEGVMADDGYRLKSHDDIRVIEL